MNSNEDEPNFLMNLTDDVIPRKKSSKRITVEETNVPKPIHGTDKKKKHFLQVDSKSKTNFNFQTSPNKERYKTKNDLSHISGSGLEYLHSSSLFKSNPEIPTLKVERHKGISEPLFSKKSFEELNLHPHLVSCLKQRMEVVTLTNVQEKTIPVLLDGKDCLVKSCTGSGKTLAYAVPILQKLQEMNPKIKRSDGVFCLIIVPTRELAIQCFECLSTLTKAFTWIVPGYLIGGEKKKSEKARLRKGINILISTAGRLLDHLDSTACLTLEKVQWLVIDEADNLLDQGFEESVTKIISKCNKISRQTVLLSATLSKGVERLAGMSLKDPVHIDVASFAGKVSEEFQQFALPSNLKQSVVIVPSKLRLAVLSAYIVDKYHQTSLKGLIFMGSQSSVDFHYSLLNSVLGPVLRDKGHKCKLFRLHGNMKQEERTEIFNSFHSTKQGILLCTDVAARGLHLPHVDWILQYSAPPSAEIYVHRVGRTARIGKKGSALLFLLPSESKFTQLLSDHKIEFEEIGATKILQSLLLIGDALTLRVQVSAEDCATALQTRYEKEVYSEEVLHQSAKDAFVSYVQFYKSYPKHIRDILPSRELHLGHVAKSFCLREAPSELGCSLPNEVHRFKSSRRNEDRPQKRKHSGRVSEYDNGLFALKHSQDGKSKKRKHR